MTNITDIKTKAELTECVYKEANEELKEFTLEFYKNYNIKLKIFYEINKIDISKSAIRDLNIHDIYESINELIVDDFPNGLQSKSRKMPFIYYKHIFYKLVYDLHRYKLKDIAGHLNQHHATVLHSVSVGANLLHNKTDRRFNFAYERIINYLRSKYMI
jgi:hypothetical protein